MDIYNVEAAEILANEALVSRTTTHSLLYRAGPFPLLTGMTYAGEFLELILPCPALPFLQQLPIAEAAPIYEKLLATFPTAVSPLEFSTTCSFVPVAAALSYHPFANPPELRLEFAYR
jgi:hypothetical protein